MQTKYLVSLYGFYLSHLFETQARNAFTVTKPGMGTVYMWDNVESAIAVTKEWPAAQVEEWLVECYPLPGQFSLVKVVYPE